ncbi:hypothetical protein BH09MYX1_BH09MYX1_29670 [soil metagenome]
MRAALANGMNRIALGAAALVAGALVFVQSPASAQSPRFRWELGAAGGPLVIDGGVGGVGGLHTQLGIQLGSIPALYYTGIFGGGAGVGNGGYFQYNTVAFEVTLLHTFQFALGPSIDIIRVGYGSSAGADRGYGVYLGAMARIGLAIGGHGRDRRGGLLLGIEIHPTFATDERFTAPTALMFTIGGGQY